MKLRTILGSLAATALAVGLTAGDTTVRAANPGTVDIKVEITSGADTAVYEVLNNDVTIVQNLQPTDLVGVDHGISAKFVVDFNAAQQGIEFYPIAGCIDTITATITNADLVGHDVVLTRDLPWAGAAATLRIDQSTEGTVVITWTAASCLLRYTSGTALFSFSTTRPLSTTTTTVTGGDLPHTGFNGSTTMIALAFLAVGTTTVVAARRRRHT